MLKLYVQGQDVLARIRENQEGVVSFEYIIVAACIIGAVAAVFGGTAAGSIQATLSGGLQKIADAFTAAA